MTKENTKIFVDKISNQLSIAKNLSDTAFRTLYYNRAGSIEALVIVESIIDSVIQALKGAEMDNDQFNFSEDGITHTGKVETRTVI